MKRVRENKRREKAALKRERRLARKQGRLDSVDAPGAEQQLDDGEQPVDQQGE
jgi:hypothetical protein